MKLIEKILSIRIAVFLFLCLYTTGLCLGQEMSFVPFQASLLSFDETSGPVDVMICLYDASEGGSELWHELHENIDISANIVSLMIGKGQSDNPIDSDFFDTDEARYVELEVGDQVLTPRYPLGSVPRALVSDEVVGMPRIISISAQTGGTGEFSVDHKIDMETHTILGMTVAIEHANGSYYNVDQSQNFLNRFFWNCTQIIGGIGNANFANKNVRILLFVERL